MVSYFFISLIFVFFFELFGRLILSFLKIDSIKCSFGIGLIIFLAYSYVVTSLYSASIGSFLIDSIVYSLFFIVGVILLIKYRHKISLKLDILDISLLVLFDVIMIYYAYNTSLGDLNGFDTTFYLNFVTSNIKAEPLNTNYYLYSIGPSPMSFQYSFQTFYYIASFFSYVFANIINLVHKTFYSTTYIWLFQNLFNFFFCSLIINALHLLKINQKKFISLVIILFFVLVYGRIYYYNVFGFYGNTFRIITIGYSTLILYLLFQDSNNKYLWFLFISSLLASSSVSSSSLFTNIFIMFAAYILLSDKCDEILRYYSVPLLFIVQNLLAVLLDGKLLICVVTSVILCIILFVFGKRINKLFVRKKIRIGIVVIVFITMVSLSFLETKNLFDFSSFLINLSERADMDINYFNLEINRYLLYLKLFILLLIIICLTRIQKEKFSMFIGILFICLFNPFCTPILYKLVPVYFRSFDIIVNPFTIVLYISFILNRFKTKIVDIFIIITLIVVISQNRIVDPLYYHESYLPGYNYNDELLTNYNNEYKMDQSDIDVIDFIYEDYKYSEIEHPYIITPNLYTQSYIPDGRYLYNRYVHSSCDYSEERTRHLFAIFYPERYKGDHIDGIIPDYKGIKEYAEIEGVDYIVVNKNKEYYDDELGKYSYLYLKISNLLESAYENERYIIFRV